ncbi:MAG: SURF1 family protein [Dermatophilaceae bacterium]
MLKKLVHPKWLGGLALATVFAVACYFLGQWQWSRYEAKAERNATLDRNYAAEPVAFPDVVDSAGVRPGGDWMRVELRGDYAADQIFVRNRPNDGVYGYEVLGILRTPDAGPVVVNRGWVQNSREGAAVLPEVLPPPTGAVTVIGWVRPFERSLNRNLPSGQVASIAEPDLSDTTGVDLAAAYVRAQTEMTGAAPVESGLMAMEPPDRSLGPHQAYAIQWWLTMALGYAFVGLGIRRELREELAEQDPEAAAAAAQARQARKKVSRWEEEDS